MPHIHTIPPEEAEGDLSALYEKYQKSLGYVPGFVSAFSLRPEAYAAWDAFIKALRGRMRMRQYELVVIAAVRAIDCVY
ncbi:MAG: hypothetical protein Fur0018_24080 [Anaerolineales bacterium]